MDELLSELKKHVEDGCKYFKENNERYHDFMKFVFDSSLNARERAILERTGKPTIEFNILESYISKLRGEFAKQEPKLSVRAADGITPDTLTKDLSLTIDLVEAHLRAIFFDGTNDMRDYNVYTDLLGGGFSAMRVFTEYVNEKSFEQNIKLERTFDPTMMVWDPLARESHKGDGRYAGELFPVTRAKFEEEYGSKKTEQMRFTKSLDGFEWSYKNENGEEIILLCDLFVKKYRKEDLYLLSNGQTMLKKEYEKFIEEWEEEARIEQAPIVKSKRKTRLEYIVRYRICESEILDEKETSFKYLPLVFADGNSVILNKDGAFEQMTRPFCYHAKGIQKLKNFAAQSAANELENFVQHKWVVPIESIPKNYTDSYTNNQIPNVVIYKHFADENDPNITLPPPREVQRQDMPPSIMQILSTSDPMTSMILGTYNPQEGVQNAPMSGVAFARSAIQSNNASVPYLVGYIKALNRVAQIIVDLIPKYYKTPRSLPVVLPNGKRTFIPINQQGAPKLNYDSNVLDVKVETGVNFSMQKEIALQTIIQLSQSNQGFAEFFNEKGLPTLLDNIEIRGIDQLKEEANEWMKQKAQQQQQAAQMQQQQAQLEAQKQAMEMAALQKQIQSPTEGEVGAELVRAKSQNDAAKIQIQAMDSETKRIETMAKIQADGIDQELKAARIQAEQTRTAVDSALKLGESISKDLNDESRLSSSDQEIPRG